MTHYNMPSGVNGQSLPPVHLPSVDPLWEPAFKRGLALPSAEKAVRYEAQAQGSEVFVRLRDSRKRAARQNKTTFRQHLTSKLRFEAMLAAGMTDERVAIDGLDWNVFEFRSSKPANDPSVGHDGMALPRFRPGDVVYIDGKRYKVKKWQKFYDFYAVSLKRTVDGTPHLYSESNLLKLAIGGRLTWPGDERGPDNDERETPSTIH